LSRKKKQFELTPQTFVLSENDVEHECLQTLMLRGYYPVRLHAGKFRTLDGKRFITGVPVGTPDYVAIHRSFPGFFLETKAKKGSLEESQRIMLRDLSLGYKLAVCVARSAAELRDWLARHEAGHGFIVTTSSKGN